MPLNVFVKPRLIGDKPALVRDPSNGKPLGAAGEWKPKTQFWIRRIAQGDVVDRTKEQIEAQKAAAPDAAIEKPADKAAVALPPAEKPAATDKASRS